MRHSVEFEIPFEQGPYTVTRWAAADPAARTVLAAHGITANGLAWAPVAAALPEAHVVAPDLRGRGRSRDVGGPYSMAAHADDLVRVLDHCAVDQALLVGHSMGGWVAATAATRHPDRFTGVLLVDGGLGFPLPADVDLDLLLDRLLGPAMAKLRTTFATPEEFLAPWHSHPAFADGLSAEVAAYLRRDIIGTEPELRSACRIEAVRDDAADQLQNPDAVSAIRRLPVPATFLWAERGLQNQTPGLYSAAIIEAAGLDECSVEVEYVSEVNHYSIVVGERGVAAVTSAIRKLL
jgi:pimeloyl-ACP methyl ester carboxylesterase